MTNVQILQRRTTSKAHSERLARRKINRHAAKGQRPEGTERGATHAAAKGAEDKPHAAGPEPAAAAAVRVNE